MKISDKEDSSPITIEKEMTNLVEKPIETGDNKVKIYPMRSRLSFTDVEIKNLEKLTRWAPYESAHYEQPLCFLCRCPKFFSLRWKFLCFCRPLIPYTNISIGQVFFVLVFLVIAGVLGYYYRKAKGKSGVLPYALAIIP